MELQPGGCLGSLLCRGRGRRDHCPDGDAAAPSHRGRCQPDKPRSRRHRLLGLGSAPPRGAGKGDGEEEEDETDRISSLPEDLLLHVLGCLRCARAAARTSVLSRRWRGLWRHMSHLRFRQIAPAALDAALAQVARAELSLLDITVRVPDHCRFSSADVASLLRAAARHAPEELSLVVRGALISGEGEGDGVVAVELPSLRRATSLRLDLRNIVLTPPPPASGAGGGFPALERLTVEGCEDLDMGGLVSRCPRLRVLEVYDCWGLSDITVHSPTVEELVVVCSHFWLLQGIDVVAPALKKFTLEDALLDSELSVSFSAPLVKDLSWHCTYCFRNVGSGEMWRLGGLDLSMKEGVYALGLHIETPQYGAINVDRTLTQEISQLPDFKALELYLYTHGHVFGAMVLNLLGTCTSIRWLKVVIRQLKTTDSCHPNCPCDQPQEWRRKKIPRMALREVEIENFEGSNHEIGFMKVLCGFSPFMRRVTFKLTPKASHDNRIYEKICNIFHGDPSVELYVHPCH